MEVAEKLMALCLSFGWKCIDVAVASCEVVCVGQQFDLFCCVVSSKAEDASSTWRNSDLELVRYYSTYRVRLGIR